jgi:hypothetical protein
VHVSRDNGANWEHVTPKDLGEWALISIIEPSPHDPATAYVAATRYKLDDFRPYLYKTNDYGKHWAKITDGIAANDFTRVIREDPTRRGLLYAGTETGMHVSFDDGGHWQPLQLNLPVVPIHDLAVKDSDLIAATHGRAFWVLDDLTPLRQATDETTKEAFHLFPPRPTVRFVTNRGFFRQPTPGKNYQMSGATIFTKTQEKKADGSVIEHFLDAGSNPPDGALVTYYLKGKPEGEVRLTFLDNQGNEIKTFKSEEKKSEGEEQKPEPGGEKKDTQSSVLSPQSLQPGINRFTWDMRYADAEGIDGFFTAEGTLPGPIASPGTYQVRLTVGDETQTQSFTIEKDPRVQATQADLDAQFALLGRIRDTINATHATIKTLRVVRAQAEEWEKRASGEKVNPAIAEHIATLKERLAPIEEDLIQTQAKVRSDTLNFPVKLNSKLAGVYGAVAGADAAPTTQSVEVFESLAGRADTHRTTLDEIVDRDVAALNTMIRDAQIPAIVPRENATKG